MKVPGTSLDPAFTVLVSTANYCVKKINRKCAHLCVYKMSGNTAGEDFVLCMRGLQGKVR